MTGDCVGLEIDEQGRLVQLKAGFGGNVVCPILSTTTPYLATLRPGMFSHINPKPVDVIKEEKLRHLENDSRIKLIEKFEPNDPIIIGRKWYENLFKKVVDIPHTKPDTPSAADAVEEKIAYKLTTFK